MGWTKREYVEQAFEEIGLASYVFDLTPEQFDLTPFTKIKIYFQKIIKHAGY